MFTIDCIICNLSTSNSIGCNLSSYDTTSFNSYYSTSYIKVMLEKEANPFALVEANTLESVTSKAIETELSSVPDDTVPLNPLP